jgi:flagellar motor switch protein FliN/FliY
MNSNNEAIPQLIALSDLPPRDGQGVAILSNSLEVIEHVKVRIAVRVGEASITVGELNRLKDEHVIRLESLVEAPVDVLLEGRVVARGQLVAVDDNFGVRITELPRPLP